MTDLEKDLLAIRVKLHFHRKKAAEFKEEMVVNHVIYAVGRALDVLNGKSLLQGLNGEGDKENDDKRETV